MDIPGKVSDLYQHVVKTCPFCNSTKPRPDRSRVSGLRAEEIGDLTFLDHGSTKIGDQTFGFPIILDGTTSHLTAFPWKSTSPSEALSKLHEWMDTFQMNPKAICADMAFHHPHDMQTFYRMHNIKRFPTGPHTPWSNRAEMGVRLLRKFLSALVDTASMTFGQDNSVTDHTCAVDAQGSDGEKHTGNSDWQNAMELAMGRRPRDLMDPASMNPEQLTSTPTEQDLLDEEIHMLAMKTQLEVQQREDLRRDPAEGMKFAPPDTRAGEQVFYGQEDPSKIQQGRTSGKWLKVEIIAVKGPMVVVNTGTSIFQTNTSRLRRPLDTVDLEEPPDSCERTGAHVLWLSCEGQIDVWELFSDNSFLSAILDRQALMVAAPADLRTKKAEGFSPQALQGFGQRLK